MIDSFILLAPLAILPIVLLFVFVGCGLSTSGLPPAQGIRLNFDRDNLLQYGVETINAKFTIATYPGNNPISVDTIPWKLADDWAWWIVYEPTLSGSGPFNVTCDATLVWPDSSSMSSPTPSTQGPLDSSAFAGWIQFKIVPLSGLAGWQVVNDTLLPPGQ